MIKKTIVNLKQNFMVCMGEFDLEDVSYNNQMANFDETQSHYFKSGLIDGVPGKYKPRKITWSINPQHHSPSLKKVANSTDDEIKFLNSIIESFKNTDWYNKIKERLNALNK